MKRCQCHGVINESTLACVYDAGVREMCQLSIMDIPVASYFMTVIFLTGELPVNYH